MNPVAAMGGYVLRKEDLEDERTSDTKGDKQFPHAHPLPFGAAFTVWLENNWQVFVSVLKILLCVLCFLCDTIQLLTVQCRAMSYVTIRCYVMQFHSVLSLHFMA